MPASTNEAIATDQPRLHSRYWERRVRPRRARAIVSLEAAGQVAATGDPDLLVDLLAGLLLYRYFLIPRELRASESDEEWLGRVIRLAERLLAPTER